MMKNPLGYMALFFIRLYQYTVSPLIGPRCRFYPTCSNYAIEAIKRYGFVKGSCLAMWRLLRCHPGSKGGFDPVPDKCSTRHSCKNASQSTRHEDTMAR